MQCVASTLHTTLELGTINSVMARGFVRNPFKQS